KLIAVRAGVSEERIIRYYGSKAGLLEAAVIQPLELAVAEVQRQWDDEAIGERSDEQFVRWFVEGFHGLIETNQTIARAVSLMLTEGPADPGFDQVRETFGDLVTPLVAVFGEQLSRRGLRAGDTRLQI